MTITRMMGEETTMRVENPMTSTVAARLDRLPVTRRHVMVVVIVGIGMFFDLYEVFLAGTLSTVFKTTFHVGPEELKLVLASAFVGAFVGAVLLSRLADRLGRRRAFYLTLGVYSIFSVLAAFSPDVWWLIVCRFIAGIGIGGELPLCDAYLSDILPARVRGRLIGWAYTVGFCAVPAAGFLARGVAQKQWAGVDGWRWMFVIGGLGAAICWALRRLLPESPRWLEAVGRADEAEAVTRQFEESARRSGATPADPAPATGGGLQPREPLTSLFRPRWRRRTVMLWIFQCLQTLGYYGFGTLVPLILTQKGFDVVTSLGYSAVTFLGYPLGSLISLPIIERVERRTLIIGSALAMTVLGLFFGFSTGSAAILVAGFLYTAASNVFSNAYHVYQGELYPTRLRATGAGSAYSLSRLATAAMPFVLLPLLDDHGSGAVFVCIGAAMVLLSIDIAVLGPRTTGRPLEDVAGGDAPVGLSPGVSQHV
jgi:MFS transporter, putative metabolite:H+ symporter